MVAVRNELVCGVQRRHLELALPGCRVAEQTWDLLPDVTGLDLCTDLKLERSDAAQANYLACAGASGLVPAYFSLDQRTTLDRRLPGSCGGYVVAPGGWSLAGLVEGVLAAPDTPLCCVGDLGLRDGRRSGSEAPSAFVAVVLLDTFWPTNFESCRGGRLRVRHRLRLGGNRQADLLAAGSDLLCLPTRVLPLA